MCNLVQNLILRSMLDTICYYDWAKLFCYKLTYLV